MDILYWNYTNSNKQVAVSKFKIYYIVKHSVQWDEIAFSLLCLEHKNESSLVGFCHFNVSVSGAISGPTQEEVLATSQLLQSQSFTVILCLEIKFMWRNLGCG